MSFLAKLGYKAPPSAPSDEYLKPTRGRPVLGSADLTRILALPRRERPSVELLAQVSEILERELSLGDRPCECVSKFHRRCCKSLKPIQTWALLELSQVGGLLGPIGVGHGKTLLDLLSAMVVENCKVAVLLVKPDLKAQLLEQDWNFYGQHWRLPNLAGRDKYFYADRPTLHVVAYSQLSGTKNSDLLERIKPDLIIADEAHAVARRKDMRSSRASRLKRYLSDNPTCRFAAWSGTLTKRSLIDYAEFSKWALQEGSPMPLHWPTVLEWAQALDPAPLRAPFGKLEAFGFPVTETLKQRRRDTLGVVTSASEDACEAELIIGERKIVAPQKVKLMLAELEASWDRPDGEPLKQVTDVAACARELSAGFYYRWVWPRGETKAVIDRWLIARRAYFSEMREKLKRGGTLMDSPALLEAAAKRWVEGYEHEGHKFAPKHRKGALPVWESEFWFDWKAVEHTAKPQTEAVWVDNFLAQDAAKWLQENVGIAWYMHTAFGAEVEKLSKCRRYGAGEEASAQIIHELGNKPIIASIRAHGTGKNLQMFAAGLVTNPPSAGDVWEQLLGRNHRDGQLQDEVVFEVYRHTNSYIEAVEKAKDLAAYIEDTFGAPQKLVSKAEWRF